jgi:hypothetical protein
MLPDNAAPRHIDTRAGAAQYLLGPCGSPKMAKTQARPAKRAC